MKTLLITSMADSVPEEYLARVRSIAAEYTVLVTRDRQEIEGYLDSIEIVFGSPPRDLLEKAPNLRWIQQWGAGADWLLRHPELADKDFILTSASGVHAVPIAEHLLAFMLCFGRGFHKALRWQGQHHWQKVAQGDLFELPGKTALVVGVGAIGAHFATLASALGVEVVGLRRDPSRSAPGVARMVGPEALRSELPRADFVVITVPLTPETRGMFGEEELRLMKQDGYLLNIGRGGTVDEEALVRALRDGRIAGAGLDVFETEPLPADSPLWDMEQVIITSHYSGLTPRYEERVFGIFIPNLERYLAGERMENVVDRGLGY
jgi:phosphoglycerate dehydrogenase-like enzyme